MPWGSWLNAEMYDRFVRERGIYAWLNRQLVDRAGVDNASRVLDLGCGTGATTLACLARMPGRSHIVGIDRSRHMVELARRNVVDPRAEFATGAASSVGHWQTDFDRVVCNAAIWQFDDLEHVFEALADRCRSRCRFSFNVPAERLIGETAPLHPFQVCLTRLVEEWAGEALPLPRKISRTRMIELGARFGFILRGTSRLVYTTTQGELMDLMSMPAMIGPLTPSLNSSQRNALLELARRETDHALRVDVPWIFFTLERCASDRPLHTR